MPKYYYPRKGSKVEQILINRVYSSIRNHPKATDKQIRSYTRYNRFQLSLRKIKLIRNDIITEKRFKTGKLLYLVYGELEIREWNSPYALLSNPAYLKYYKLFNTKKRAENHYNKMIIEFTQELNELAGYNVRKSIMTIQLIKWVGKEKRYDIIKSTNFR